MRSASRVAVGKTSFVDCPMLTWSFGWTRVYVASRLSEDFRRPVGEHLVRVHVVGCAGASLIDIDHELIAQGAAQNLVSGTDNRARDLCVEAPELGVGLGRRLLDENRRRDEIGVRAESADGKVFDGTRRLCPVVGVGGHLHMTERVVFGPEGRLIHVPVRIILARYGTTFSAGEPAVFS